MSEEQSNDYRPRSPDLSAFVPPPPLNRLPSYHQPDTSNTGFPPDYSFSPRGSYDASPYFSPQTTQAASSYFGSQIYQTPSQTQSPPSARTPSVPASLRQSLSQPYNPVPKLENPQLRQQLTQPPIFHSPVYQSSPAQLNFGSPSTVPLHNQIYPDMGRTRQRKPVEDHDDEYSPNNSLGQPMAGSMLPTTQQQQNPPTMPQLTTFDPTHNIDVKTKFPVARIKRIMQADEDVGKVAQATPTAVAKALELFMITLVAKGANEARQQNSKRVTAQHLKAALMKDGQFDFLVDTCADVPDEGTKKGRAKSEAKSEDSDQDMDEVKPKKGKAKRKKTDPDDDSDF